MRRFKPKASFSPARISVRISLASLVLTACASQSANLHSSAPPLIPGTLAPAPNQQPAQENQEKPLAEFGIEDIDANIRSDFLRIESSPVQLEGERTLTVREFLEMIKQQLNCPTDCNGFVLCEDEIAEPKRQLCRIEWSRTISQDPNQDLEPGSIWTLEYVKKGELIEPATLSAIWKDF